MKRILLTTVAALGAAGPAPAQRLYFQNGADLEWSEVTLNGTNLMIGGRSLPASNVIRVDWPYPEELSDALTLILKQKYDDALKKAQSVRETHANWKDKPGSWYVPATLLVVECHIRKNNAAETDKILTELRNMTLSSNYQKGLLMVQALEDFQKDATTPALEKAQRALKDTEDSALLARLHLLIGDIKFKRDLFREALDSYLHVPVFFGAQGQLMPVAELGAAKSLFHLRRLADASKALGHIVERYKDTPEAAEAGALKEEVDKVITGGTAEPEATDAKPAEDEK
jgi:hypothetical protein